MTPVVASGSGEMSKAISGGGRVSVAWIASECGWNHYDMLQVNTSLSAGRIASSPLVPQGTNSCSGPQASVSSSPLGDSEDALKEGSWGSSSQDGYTMLHR